MPFHLEEIIDLNRLDDNRFRYSFRVYISKDKQTNVYKVSICGLKKEDRIVLYGTKDVIQRKLKDLIGALAHTLKELDSPFL